MRPLLIFCLIALLASCAPPADLVPPTAPTVSNVPAADVSPSNATALPAAWAGGPVTITFAVDEFERAAYEALAERFMAEQPAITVQLVTIPEAIAGPDGIFRPGEYLRQVAEAADSFTIWDGDASFGVRQGLFLDLAPLIDADPSFARDDMLPGVLVADDGAIGMVPNRLSVALYAYNRPLLAERGVAEPGPDATLTELITIARQVAVPGEGDTAIYGIYDPQLPFDLLLHELRAAGIDLDLSATGMPPPLRDERYADALALVQALIAEGAILRDPPNAGSLVNDRRSYRLIDRGQVAIWPADYVFAPPAGRTDADIGLLPNPRQATEGTSFFSQGYAVSAGTAHPEATWRWINFLSRNFIPLLPSNTGWLPARRSQLEEYWQGVSVAEREVMQRVAEQLRPRPATQALPEVTAMRVALGTAMNQILDEGVGLAAALSVAETTAQEELLRLASVPTPTPDPRPVVVGAPAPTPAPAAAAQTVRFGVQPWLGGEVRAAVAAFIREQSDVIPIVTTRDGSSAGSPAALAQQFDCFIGLGGADMGGATLDLQPLIDADPRFDVGDIAPQLLEAMRQQGQLVGLPLTMDLPVLVYNRDRFTEAGLAPPTAAWTIDDLIAAAEQLSSGTGANRRYGLVDPDPELLMVLFEGSGVAVVRNDGQGPAPRFTDPAVLAVTQRFISLVRQTTPNDRFTVLGGGQTNPDAAAAVQAGRVAMWLGTTSFIPYSEGSNLPLALAPLPLASGAQPRVNVAEAVYIAAGNARSEACWRWITALSADLNFASAQGLPARLSLLDTVAAAPNAPTGLAEVVVAYRAALTSTRGPGTLNDTGDVSLFWLYRAVDRALQGADLERELEEAQFITEQFMACVRGGESPAACAPQVDPEYSR